MFIKPGYPRLVIPNLPLEFRYIAVSFENASMRVIVSVYSEAAGIQFHNVKGMHFRHDDETFQSRFGQGRTDAHR